MSGFQSKKRRWPEPGGASPIDVYAHRAHELKRAFYQRPAAIVARELLGTIVISTVGGALCAGRIVESEAYTGPDDEASHAAARIGRTRRNETMFGPAGHAYVYRIYGVHWCLNAVSDRAGFPSAVLIRAAEPIAGWDVARARRFGRHDRELMRGPGNLCAALGITSELDGHPLDRMPLIIAAGSPVRDDEIAAGPRIGVTRAVDLPLRFWIAGNPWVSASTRARS
jgi:DNA-3-methyladenine glycosylase